MARGGSTASGINCASLLELPHQPAGAASTRQPSRSAQGELLLMRPCGRGPDAKPNGWQQRTAHTFRWQEGSLLWAAGAHAADGACAPHCSCEHGMCVVKSSSGCGYQVNKRDAAGLPCLFERATPWGLRCGLRVPAFGGGFGAAAEPFNLQHVATEETNFCI
mmetsp:Transcript_38698/g.114994  ORF Transcript_38698/g.114994 Transcript_38698/m.114994 type:complete len:163 (-) Transcript_38698:142-630(-)|eukprot:364420-Chlamydomonas_euryale.AAC.5